MKTIISNELLKRIQCASANGSIIATDLLALLRANKNKHVSELTGGKHANYFDSVRVINHGSTYTTVKVEVTCCNKDLTNPNFPDAKNPEAPYFKENRTRLTAVGFARLFPVIESGGYTEAEWAYFDSAIRLPSKVTLSISSNMHDIEYAYAEENYTHYIENNSDCATLHNSCMRHTDKDLPRNAADFYTHVAGASIMTAKNEDGEVLARSIIWRGVHLKTLGVALDFMERVYFTYNFLVPMMRVFAVKNGIVLRKQYSDYSHKEAFIFMADYDAPDGRQIPANFDFTSTATKVIPAAKWHKRGVPYLDTMSYLKYNPEAEQLYLENTYTNNVAELIGTGGCASDHNNYICPACGKLHVDSAVFCRDCQAKYTQNTDFGNIIASPVKKWRGHYIPSFLFQGTAPNKHCQSYLVTEKFFKS